MDSNSVYSKMQNFVNIPVSYNFFMEQLKDSNESNKIVCWYTTEEGINRRYSMYWDSAAYVGNEASLTKEDNDMYNLQGDYSDGDWRTLDTTTVSRFRYNNKTYIIK